MNIHSEINGFLNHLNKLCIMLSLDDSTINPNYKIVIKNGLVYLLEDNSKSTIWIDAKLQEKEVINEYCSIDAHIHNFNF